MPASHHQAPPVGNVPPLVDFDQIRTLILQGSIGIVRLNAMMRSPGAPAPVIGGMGSKRVWSSKAVTAYLERIAEEGWTDSKQEQAA